MNINDQKVYLFITSQKVDLAENNFKIIPDQINNKIEIIQVKITH
jgi:hypothetical protein